MIFEAICVGLLAWVLIAAWIAWECRDRDDDDA